MQPIAVIVPCYNESLRLQTEAFLSFLQQHEEVSLFFINDGSTDDTLNHLEKIRSGYIDRCQVISLEKNKGKAEAVRTGLLRAAEENKFTCIAFLDADLSTSTEQFYQLYQKLVETKSDYIIGSRVKMMNTVIERSFFRHIAGRVVASLIDSRYHLGIYDTQCGAKIFKAELIPVFCTDPFITRWLFDVEILLRLQKQEPAIRGIEYPLTGWKDPGGSKISLLHIPVILNAIFRLYRHYKKTGAA